MDIATHVWSREERDLWDRLRSHPFEDPAIDLDFTRRLARVLGWSVDTARTGIEEYRRFCFLACVGHGIVTPSEEVDEVWHLHLTYTRDYWDRWCGEALRRTLHHDPTAGGPSEDRLYRSHYAETLASYETYFGPPPVAFWPGTSKRFAAKGRYRLVDRDKVLVLPRPSVRPFGRVRAGVASILTALSTPVSAASTLNPLDLNGKDFLSLFVLLIAAAVCLTVALRYAIRRTGRLADARGLSAIESAYVASGPARAADTLFLALAGRGAASHADNRVTIRNGSRDLQPDVAAFHADLRGTWFRKDFIRRFRESPAAHAMIESLQRRNMILHPTRQALMTLATAVPLGAVLSLGILKIVVGLSRDKPVLFLVLLCVFTLFFWIVVLLRERRLSAEGRAALAALRTRWDRAIRAPRSEEIALAFAFGGAAVLAGTEHAAYAKVVQPPGGGGDGSSGCSSSGCGSGGGGCGGCSS